MYVWADGINVIIRLEQQRLCLLVLVGVNPDGFESPALASASGTSVTSSSVIAEGCRGKTPLLM